MVGGEGGEAAAPAAAPVAPAGEGGAGAGTSTGVRASTLTMSSVCEREEVTFMRVEPSTRCCSPQFSSAHASLKLPTAYSLRFST